MSPTALALARAETRLHDRLTDLERRIDAGEDVWPSYCQTVAALATLPARGDRVGELLSTKDLADRLGVTPKTLLRRRAKGELKPALELGERGRAAFRWRAP